MAALIAGAVIYFTGWLQIDPMLSLFVPADSEVDHRRTARVLPFFDGRRAPSHRLFPGRGRLDGHSGVLSVHDLHVWEMTPGQPALIGHIEVRDMQEWPKCCARSSKCFFSGMASIM